MERKSMLISDWEGPWITADHAYAVISKGVPNGDRVFEQISAYDDYQYWVVKREKYEPGDTLYLISPFIIAFGKDEAFLNEIADENANYIAGAISTLKLLDKLGYKPSIVSTSYEQYVQPTVSLAGIPLSRVYCTNFPLDQYLAEVSKAGKELVRNWAKKILELPRIEVDEKSSLETMSKETLQATQELDKLFWEILPNTSFARVMKEVKPRGGSRKTQSVEQALYNEGKYYQQAVVVGDSITDSHMLGKTQENDGLAVGFNPNSYAAVKSQVIIMCDDCITTAVVVDGYEKHGLDGIRDIANEWSYETLARARIEPEIINQFRSAYPKPEERFPKVVWVTPENLEQTISEAKVWRKSVRGARIGALG